MLRQRGRTDFSSRSSLGQPAAPTWAAAWRVHFKDDPSLRIRCTAGPQQGQRCWAAAGQLRNLQFIGRPFVPCRGVGPIRGGGFCKSSAVTLSQLSEWGPLAWTLPWALTH